MLYEVITVQLMGGELGIESEPGQGSVFWFALPLPAAPCVSALAGDGVEASAFTDRRAFNVLLAEDIDENAELARLRLESEGHAVTRVGNGLV